MLNRFFFVNHKLFFLIIISLLFHLLASFFSVGFYEQDEHFSILEPITYKFGENATLGWDFFYNYDKQWFLSFIFYYLIKLLLFFNIESPFTWMIFIRFFSGILGWISIICLLHLAKKIILQEKYFNACFYITTLFWFYPYFHVRPASENISISFLIIALTLFVYFNKNLKILFFCGLIFGLSFVIRFTNLFLIGTFGMWFLIFFNNNFKKVLISFVLFFSLITVFLISLFIDYWGYEKFELVVLNYFLLNYEWSQMGYYQSNTDQWWYNFYFILKEFLPPISILIIISMLVFWARFKKNIITWTTLPYFIFLCTTPHKETRFLFPVLSFAPIYLAASFENFTIKGKEIIEVIFKFKLVKFIISIIIIINLIALIALSLSPANQSTLLYKFLYNNKYNINKIYTLDKIPYKKSDLLINFYRNKDISFTKIASIDECRKIEVENDFKITNYDKEFLFKEIQKYSYPKWYFQYYIQCNKENFVKDFNIKDTKYYLIHKLKFLELFSDKRKSKCELLYSTIPSIFLKINYNNWAKNLSSWQVYKCSK